MLFPQGGLSSDPRPAAPPHPLHPDGPGPASDLGGGRPVAGLPPHRAEQHLPCGHTRALAATGRGLAMECTRQTERASSQITANSRTDGHSHRPFTGARMSTRSSALHVIGRAHLCQHRLALRALNYGRGRARFMRLRVAFLARFLPGSLSFPPPRRVRAHSEGRDSALGPLLPARFLFYCIRVAI